MKLGAHTVLAAAARFYTPLIVLFALTLLAGRPAGGGIGFIAALAFLLAFLVHALVFGAAAARRAAPPLAMRTLAAFGLLACATGAAVRGAPFARELLEAGVFVLTAGGGALAVVVLFGRAPTLREDAS